MFVSQIEGVKDYAFGRLDADTGALPDYAHFHSKQHTKRVYERARYLAEQEGVSSEDMKVLETAALLHDVGHIESVDSHEEVGVRIAGQILPESGYTDDEVEEVQEIIMSTKVDLGGEGPLHVNPPQNNLQRIICDADLDNLGREDFYERSEELRRELAGRGMELSREAHYSNTLDLMQRHHYFTHTQEKERAPQKQEFMDELKEALETGKIKVLVEARI